MARIADTFVPTNTLYARGTENAVLDLRYGGQNGWSPDFSTWLNNQPYVSSPLICLVLEYPRGFAKFPDADKWIGALKSLCETKAKRIEGLSKRLEVNTDEVPFGGGGQKHEVPTNVTEAPPNISFTWQELVGMPVNRFLTSWINLLIMNQNTKYADAYTNGIQLTDTLADQYSATMAFIEPDRSFKSVNQAWIVTNMFPKGTGDNNAKRDLNSPQEIRELNIEFAGIAQQGAGVNEFAQLLLDRIDIKGASPEYQRSHVQKIADRLQAIKHGFSDTVDSVANQQSRL
jgi:hypothetical protein